MIIVFAFITTFLVGPRERGRMYRFTSESPQALPSIANTRWCWLEIHETRPIIYAYQWYVNDSKEVECFQIGTIDWVWGTFEIKPATQQASLTYWKKSYFLGRNRLFTMMHHTAEREFSVLVTDMHTGEEKESCTWHTLSSNDFGKEATRLLSSERYKLVEEIS